MSNLTAPIPTMSSLEIVDLINEDRKAEAAGGEFTVLLHKNFLAKIESHPGIQSAKFSADYKDARGRTQKCYRLPKREAELMVMSESLKVQTRVYDRLAAIEGQGLDRTQLRVDTKSSNRNMNGILEMAREDEGKSCKSHHYSNEALMINEIIFGVRTAIDRDSLSASDLNKVIKMEMRNALFIGRGLSYAKRKDLLKKYHEQLLLPPPPKTKLLKEKRA